MLPNGSLEKRSYLEMTTWRPDDMAVDDDADASLITVREWYWYSIVLKLSVRNITLI